MVPPRRGQQLVGFRKRRMAPRPSKPSPRLSRPSLRPAMAPPWPARPWTAVLWLPKATDGTSAFKTLAALQPAQSSTSSSNGEPGPGQQFYGFRKRRMAPRPSKPSPHFSRPSLRPAMAPPWPARPLASESDGWHLGLQNPRRPGPGQQFYGFRKRRMAPRPSKASPRLSRPSLRPALALDSSSMASESDGWHLGLQKPRRASAGPVFVQQWRLRGQPSPGQQFYGVRKRRMAPRPSKPSPRLSRPSPVLWLPKATDGTSAFKTLAAAQSSSSNGASVASQALDSSSMASESDGWLKSFAAPQPTQSSSSNGASGWHLGLQKPRRASAGPVFVQQWRLRGQPGPGQEFYGFRKRRMAPRPSKASPRLSRPSLRPAMAPPWPAMPWTAVLWLPKATDGTSGFKTLAAPDSDGWHLGLENPRRASAGPVFVQQWWRLRGQPSPGYMASESDGWHLGLANPRRARSDGWHLGLRGQPRPCQHFYGFRKRRMAPRAWKPSPRLRPTVATVARLAHHML